ncbi:hypothetical protein LR48_Vigan06g153100 [Vigna angularis]|uniref:Uncharacterized protein n=1 Tax=Phaseolus angularis TaxID=3914 RepID=A0A0L9UTM3_PHAAN|nr:hypothetical protein LR48_Vigan06g153100 [Vigna angularis]
MTVRFSSASSDPSARAVRSVSTDEKASARSLAASSFVRPSSPFVSIRPVFDKLMCFNRVLTDSVETA